MKQKYYLFIVLFVLGILYLSNALAGLPPTTSKLSSDSNNVTTFNYQFPNFAGTHTGTTVSLGVLSPAGGGTGTGTLFTQGSVPFAGASGIFAQDNARFFWDNTNKFLGLGYNVPASNLHIDAGTATASALKFTAGSTTGQLSTNGFDIGISTAGNGEIRQRGALPINFFTNNTQFATILSDGKFGLGTTSPGFKAVVNMSSATVYAPSGAAASPYGANDAVLEVSNTSATNGSSAFLSLSPINAGGANNKAYIGSVSTTTVFTPTIVFGMRTASATYAERMRIDSNGLLGIGTTAPGEIVHASSAATAGTALRLDNTDTGGRNYNVRSTGSTSSIGAGKFSVGDVTAGAIRMVIDSTGNVGINVGSPGSRLSVVGTTADNTTVAMNIANSALASIVYARNDKVVGINTTSPGSTLHVAGSYQGQLNALSADTTLDVTYQYVTVDATSAATTITIPDCGSGSLGRVYHIKKIDSSSNAVILARTATDTFDGATSYSLLNQWDSVSIVCASTTLWAIF